MINVVLEIYESNETSTIDPKNENINPALLSITNTKTFNKIRLKFTLKEEESR